MPAGFWNESDTILVSNSPQSSWKTEKKMQIIVI